MKSLKAITLVAVIALAGVMTANAEIRFGIKAGTNINKLHLSEVTDNFKSENRCGFTGGVMTEFTVPIVGIGFDISLMYTHMEGELIDGRNEGTVTKNFLEVPLNLKYKLNIPVINNIVRPMLFTGPTMAVKLDNSIVNDIKAKRMQWGWNVGVGVELIKHLQISGGYTIGINNIVDTAIKNVNVTDNVKAKNNYWTVTAAWLF